MVGVAGGRCWLFGVGYWLLIRASVVGCDVVCWFWFGFVLLATADWFCLVRAVVL